MKPARPLSLVPPVMSDAELLAELNAAVASAEMALREAIYGRDAFCRQWSEDNGYCVRLRVEQVQRAIQGIKS